MHFPRIENWGAVGEPEDGTGFITYGRSAMHWRLLDAWLSYGHPHWGWWYRLWGRILPYWGDPFCAAYTVVWSPFYWSREESRATVHVGWDALPPAVKERILKSRDEPRDTPALPALAATPGPATE